MLCGSSLLYLPKTQAKNSIVKLQMRLWNYDRLYNMMIFKMEKRNLMRPVFCSSSLLYFLELLTKASTVKLQLIF